MRAVIRAVVVALCALAPIVAIAGEVEERAVIEVAAKDAFLAGRFDELDAMADGFRSGRGVTGAGASKLFVFYGALNSSVGLYGVYGKDTADKIDAQVDAWLGAHPDSKTAIILKAKGFLRRAWLARGEGFAGAIREEQWKEMFAYTVKASQTLDRSRAFASDDPQWHAIYLEVAKISGWPRASLEALAKDALDLDPTYGGIHDTLLLGKQPVWGGSWPEYDVAIQDIVARTSAKYGQIYYAKLYSDLAITKLRKRIFEKSLANWPRMKQGFIELLEQYPSDGNLNRYGISACLAKDWDTLKIIFDKLDGKFVDSLWISQAARELCQRELKDRALAAEDAAHYAKPIPVPLEISERHQIEYEATSALMDGRFDEIETVRARLLASKETTSGGSWKLVWYTEGLSPYRLVVGGTMELSQKIRAQIARWRASKPNSVGAAIAAARLALIDGRIVRDLQSKPAETGQGVSEVAKFLAQARRDLESSRVGGERDPVWWSTLLAVNNDDLVSEEAFDAVAAQALSVEPDYGETRAVILGRPKPRRNEFRKEHKRAVAFVLNALPPERADEVYAAAYLMIGDQWGGDDIVQMMNVDWPRMRAGMETIVARWPSDWNLTVYARFACMAKDKVIAAALLHRLGDRLVEPRWPNWRAHAQCREWAFAEE